MRAILSTLALIVPLAASAAFPAPRPAPCPAPVGAPVEVMIVGDFHMANPGRDLHNLAVDDVLAPRRQTEIARITDALARFRPTKVAAEWDEETAAERWAKYRAGTLPASRNEVVQLAFRLAKTAGLSAVYGLDVEGDFPYKPVQAWAAAHGRSALIDEQNADIEQMLATESRLLKDRGISGLLRYLNDPARLKDDNAFYRTTLFMGAGDAQPGADLLTAWYHRNFLICSHLLQIASPGDRIVVFYGAGHTFLLRQCVAETPGFRLVEPNAWLPK